jgi:hypothetical protein
VVHGPLIGWVPGLRLAVIVTANRSGPLGQARAPGAMEIEPHRREREVANEGVALALAGDTMLGRTVAKAIVAAGADALVADEVLGPPRLSIG